MRVFLKMIPATLIVVAGCVKQPAADRGRAALANRPVPVTVASAEQRDVPIYLDGLGTVTAYRTVTVRAQVDGRLDRILFKEGQTVKRGEALAQIDPRPYLNQLHQAEAALARDQATLDMNRRNLERYDGLARKKLIAAQQADDQRGLVAQGDAAVRADRAAVDVAKLNLEYARITSPIDGVVGLRNVDAGNLVHASDPTGLVTITQLDPIAVVFSLPQDVLPKVSLHQAASELSVVVFSREGERELGRGKLEVIDNAINTATSTLRFKAVLPNPGHALWPNQFVKARLMVTVRRGAVVIPAPAIQRGPDGPFVYVVTSDGTAQARPIVVELLQGNDGLIQKGVTPGDAVVIEGQNQLRPGSRVALHARPPMPGGGTAPRGGPARSRQASGRSPSGSAPVSRGTP